MTPQTFSELASTFAERSVAVVGDFCLDRYLEIDGRTQERSLETGRHVMIIGRSRCQAGGAGTIVNNLLALGVGRVVVIGRTGCDGEGWEMRRLLAGDSRVDTGALVESPGPTMTYMKAIRKHSGECYELLRLDVKHRDPIPRDIEKELCVAIAKSAATVDAMIVLDQVADPPRGVVTAAVLDSLGRASCDRPGLPIIADSRAGLARFPKVDWKMNRNEFALTTKWTILLRADVDSVCRRAGVLAERNGGRVWVTLAEDGLVVGQPDGTATLHRALPVRGPIDVVGAGDAVSANLAVALAAGSSAGDAAEIAMAAASVVLHKVGTTGAATPDEIARQLTVE